MGASVIITGLSSEIAQTLVTLGVDLGKLNAVGDLQGGIEEAERLLGYEVSPVDYLPSDGALADVASRSSSRAVLIASIQTALTDTDLLQFREDVMSQITRHRSRGIIVDVTALDVMDSFVSRTLRGIAHDDAPARRRDRDRRHPARGRVRDGAARHEVRRRRDGARPRGGAGAARTQLKEPLDGGG